MSKFKTYKELLEKQEDLLLTDGKEKKELSVISVNENTALIASELQKGLTKDVIAKISDYIPGAAHNLILANDAISDEKRTALAKISDEMVTDLYTVQRRRSDIEKRMSVLQDNRFTTPAAKFHQAKLESTVQWNNAINNALNIEKLKIKLEKLKYKYDKKKEKLALFKKEGKETFYIEKKIQLLAIDITEQLIGLKNNQIEADNLASELLEWSKLKDQLYIEAESANELWNPEDVNYGQDVFLTRRFFQSYLIAHQNGSDNQSTSDILNIDGLASGSFKETLKKGTLGKVLEDFADEQIRHLFTGLCGYDVKVIRQGTLPVAVLNLSLTENNLLVISKDIKFADTSAPALESPTI